MTVEELARRERAAGRAEVMVINKTRLGQPERDFSSVKGEAAISLTTRLTVESFALTGIAHVRYARANVPVRFVPRTRP